MNTTRDIAKTFINSLKNEEFVTDRTGQKTIEMLGATFLADEPAIFGTPNAVSYTHLTLPTSG